MMSYAKKGKKKEEKIKCVFILTFFLLTEL